MNHILHKALYSAAIIAVSAILLVAASALKNLVGFSSGTVAIAVILPLLFGRSPMANKKLCRCLLVLAPSSIAIAASIHDLGIWKDFLLVTMLSAAIWIRRFGPFFTPMGMAASLPFIGILLLPGELPLDNALYPSLLAILAVISVSGVQMVFGYNTRQSASAHSPSPARMGRLTPSTRISIQMALALSLSLVISRYISTSHWNWMVITVWIVLTGTRSREDVVLKGIQRIAGASAGTLLASWTISLQGLHSETTVYMIIFALFLALWWRWKSYAFWAAGITLALGLFYSLYQTQGEAILLERLQLILCGGILATCVAWFAWPVRAEDLLRLRLAQALASLSELLSSLHQDSSPSRWSEQLLRYKQAVTGINIACAPLKVLRYLLQPIKVPEKLHIVLTWSSVMQETDEMTTNLVSSWPANVDPRSLHELEILRKQVGQLRRSMTKKKIGELITVQPDTHETSDRHELLLQLSLHLKNLPPWP